MLGFPFVGRSFEHPSEQLLYYVEREHHGYLDMHGPGKHWRRRFTGRTEDFREYGEALASRVNPLLVPLMMKERHPVRERLIAEAHREWDFLGIRDR